MHLPSGTDRRRFTLFELLVVIGLLMILATILSHPAD